MRILALLLLLVPSFAAATVDVAVPPEAGAVRMVAAEDAVGAAQALATEIAAERRDLAALLGRPDSLPVQIRVARGREEFDALQPEGMRAPPWASGVAYPGAGVAVIDLTASARGGAAATTLRHELAHVALGRIAPDGVPRWFTEGFAQVHAGEWSLSRSATLMRAATAKALIPLDELSQGFPSSPTDVDLAYAESASMVAYMAGVDDGVALHRLFSELGAGKPFARALATAFAQPFVNLEIDWRRHLSTRFGWVSFFTDGNLLWTGAAMVVAFGALRARRASRRRIDELAVREEAEAALRGVEARRAWLDAQAGGASGLARF